MLVCNLSKDFKLLNYLICYSADVNYNIFDSMHYQHVYIYELNLMNFFIFD